MPKKVKQGRGGTTPLFIPVKIQKSHTSLTMGTTTGSRSRTRRKKRRSEAARDPGQRGIGTRSQQALQLAREQNRLEKRESSRARRQAEQARRFALRTEKRREKHRGH